MGAIGVALSNSPHNGLSFLVGGLLIFVNFVFLSSGWSLIFKKKLIALAVLLIVIKYAILGIIIYHAVRDSWVEPVWFALGISSFVATILVYTQRQHGI